MSQIQVALSKTPNLAVIFISQDGVIKFINKKFEEIFKLTTKVYLGEKFSHLKNLSNGLGQIYNCLKSTQTNLYQSRNIVIQIENSYFRATISNVLENAKIYSGFIITIVDITHEKELEIREKCNERLLMQNAKMALLGEMISSISHQQRQPLSSAMLSLDNIIDCFENGDLKSAKNHIEKCKKAIKLLDDTIISFRNFYKNNNEISIFDMKDIINELICIIKSYMNTKKITLDFVYKNEKFLVKSIPTYVKQILLALLANAKDELIQCGFDENFEAKILINLEKIDDEIRVSISDNGRGFEIENKEIYNSFYTTKPNGTGMGLYIAKSLAEDKLNGRLKLENLRNPTKFSLYLKHLDIKND